MIIELNRKTEHNIPEEQLNALAMSFYYAIRKQAACENNSENVYAECA